MSEVNKKREEEERREDNVPCRDEYVRKTRPVDQLFEKEKDKREAGRYSASIRIDFDVSTRLSCCTALRTCVSALCDDQCVSREREG